MSRYRDSGSSDCKLYVGDLGKIVNNLAVFVDIYLINCIVYVLSITWLGLDD